MNALYNIFTGELIHAIGWTVINSVWQICIIAFVLAICLQLTSDTRPKLKYNLSLLGLGSVLFSSVVTFLFLFLGSSKNETIVVHQQTTYDIASAQSVIFQSTQSSNNWIENLTCFLTSNLNMIVLAWAIGVVILGLWFVRGIFGIYQLRSSAIEVKSKKWQYKLLQLAKNFPVNRTIKLAESTHALAPMTVGFIKPLILLPIGTINQLNGAEVEAILAHELAHIYRHDYIINICQTLVEILFYFHPAVWWISSQIRKERENCCDDLAIGVTNQKLNYAKALVSIQENVPSKPKLALYFFGNNKNLLSRIQRILNQPPTKPRYMEKIISITLLLVFFVGITASAINSEHNIKDESKKEELAEKATKLSSDNIKILSAKKDAIFSKLVFPTISSNAGFHAPLTIEPNLNIEPKENNKKSKIIKQKRIAKLPVASTQLIYEDTIPDGQEVHFEIQYIDEGKTVEIRKEGGKTTKVWVNGEVLDEDEYEYEQDDYKIQLKTTSDVESPVEPTSPSSPVSPTSPSAPIYPSALESPTPPTPPSGTSSIEVIKKSIIGNDNDTIFIIKENDNVKSITIDIEDFDFDEIDLDEILEKFDIDLEDLNFDLNLDFDDAHNNIEKNLNLKLKELDEDLENITIELDEGELYIIADTDHTNDLNKVFTEELLNDNLIQDKNDYNFKLTQKYFKVGGTKHTGPVHKKYLKLFEDTVDGSLGKDFSFENKVSRNRSKTAIRID